MPMNVLLVGGHGMLGQELAKVFGDTSLKVVDRQEMDITSVRAVKKVVADYQPEVIINSSAYNNVDGAESDFVTAKRINATGVVHLARAAVEAGALLVHFSTDYVFDGSKKEGYREDDQPAPQSKYGESKMLGEQSIQKICSQYYIIRLSRLFGKQGSSSQTKESFVDKMVRLAKTETVLTVIDEELSCPTYAPDLAARTRELIDRRPPFGIYHLTNAGACTWYQFAKEIFSQRQWNGTVVPVPANTFPRPAPRPRFSVLRNTKLEPLRPWQEALKDYLANVSTV